MTSVLATDSLAIWAGVIGAAVGGLFAFLISLIQNRTTRGEGRAGRTHDRDMRLWDSRASAYVSVLDYAGRLVGWMEDIRDAARRVTGPTTIMAGWVLWTGDEWFTMMAGLRAFGTPSVMEGFLNLHNAGSSLNGLIKHSQTVGTVTPAQIEAACIYIHDCAVGLQKRVTADLQDPT